MGTPLPVRSPRFSLWDLLAAMRHFMNCRVLNLAAICLFLSGIMSGCGSESTSSPESKDAEKSVAETKNPGGPSGDAPGGVKKSPSVPEPQGPTFEDQLKTIVADIGNAEWNAAETGLAGLREKSGEELTEEQRASLTEVEQSLTAAREAVRREQRDVLLAEARATFEKGEWDAALKQIDAVAALAPTETERVTLNELRTTIDKVMKAERRLASWIRMLGSDDGSSVKAAQTQLLEDSETALPLVRQAIRKNDPATTKNALELLRKMKNPEATLPIMISVLENPEQEGNWEVAVKEMLRLQHPGAGPKLLELAQSQHAQQRQIALSALSSAIDPPADTAMTLLPTTFQDSSDLSAALLAMTHCVLVHHQHDVNAWYGLRETVSDAEGQQIGQLAERLRSLMALPAENSETIDAARRLAMSLRLVNAEPIPGVQIFEATPTDPPINPSALLDGVWNSTDLTSMWWNPVNQTGFVVIDLGDTKTVTGVRIWNFNEASGGIRGWKDVEVFVSDSPTALEPVSEGMLLPAPGIEAPLDYSQVLGVEFVRGRYVKLVCKSYQSQSTYAGLSEIQVLGY